MEVHAERVAARLARAQAEEASTAAMAATASNTEPELETPATASNTEPSTETPATASNNEPARNTEEERVVDLESEEGEEDDFREVSEGYNGSEDEFDARVRDEE